MSGICYTLGEPGGVASTDTGSNHLLPLEGKHMAFDTLRNITLLEKLEANSIPEPNSGCQLWTAGLSCNGYGQVNWQRRPHLAHRLAWINRHGPIPAGMCICHKCDVPTCINPDHLFLGSHAANVADKVAKGRGRNGPSRGEKNGNSKLTAAAIRAIREDPRPHRRIAADYGCSQVTISLVKRRAVWAHVP